MNTDEFRKAYDKASAAYHADKPRGHLGASVIGNRCVRQVWYGFRWAHRTQHTGRLHRLFIRGHEEEFRFVRYLRSMGATVRDYAERLTLLPDGTYRAVPWDEINFEGRDVSANWAHIAVAAEKGIKLKQFGFKTHNGHFAGSCDGMIWDPVHFAEDWGLLEFKTHSDKSFKQLTSKGLVSSKQTHYVQMQIYMYHLGLRWGLYCAVNKNTDEVFFDIVVAKPEIAEHYNDIALKIIKANKPPQRITENKAWFECKFCDFRQICHYNSGMEKSCRSCVYAEPVDDGKWRCNLHKQEIPREFQPIGCDNWSAIE